MSGTQQIRPNAELNHKDFPTSHAASSLSLTSTSPALKRVNTPPSLNLLALMSSDASALAATAGHRRVHSAVGEQTVAGSKNSVVNSMAPDEKAMRPMTSASAMTALQMGLDSMRSPCFVHKTFGASIDLERVIDECRAEEMTHHNLLQTATGVREVARQLGMSCLNFELV
jgi:NAD+ kinase